MGISAATYLLPDINFGFYLLDMTCLNSIFFLSKPLSINNLTKRMLLKGYHVNG